MEVKICLGDTVGPNEVRDDVLARLLALNGKRAQLERIMAEQAAASRENRTAEGLTQWLKLLHPKYRTAPLSGITSPTP